MNVKTTIYAFGGAVEKVLTQASALELAKVILENGGRIELAATKAPLDDEATVIPDA